MKSKKTTELIYFVSGMWCSNCAVRLRKTISAVPKVLNANINYSTKLLTVQTNQENSDSIQNDILKAITSNGFSGKVQRDGWLQSLQEDLRREGEQKLSWILIGLVWFLAMWSSMIAFSSYIGGNLPLEDNFKLTLLSAVFGLPAIAIGVYPYAISGWQSLKHNRVPTLDLFITIGAFCAILVSLFYLCTGFSISYADSGSMILAILLLTKKTENLIAQKLSSNILYQLGNKSNQVQLLKNNKWISANINQIKNGDRIRVKKGETVPVDGLLESIQGFLNNHLISGESQSIDVRKGDHILAGTISLSELEITTQSPQGVRKIDQWAEQAFIKNNSNVSRSLNFENLEILLVYFAFLGAISIAFSFYLSGADTSKVIESFFVGILIFCPCLFASIIPLIKQMIYYSLLKLGILIQRFEAVWDLGHIDSIYIDKTGTLEHVESSIIYFNSQNHLDNLIYQISTKSSHPILRGLNLNPPTDKTKSDLISTEEIPNKGIVANCLNGDTLIIGSFNLMKEHGVKALPLTRSLPPYPLISLNNNIVGYILTQNIYDKSSELFLKNILKRFPNNFIHILSGDKQENAGESLQSLDSRIRFYGNLDPSEKAHLIHGNSLFIGDGIDDSLALSKSTVGVRLGHRTIGFGPVDFHLIQPNLNFILDLLDYSKRCRRVLTQTIVLAFSYNIISIALAIKGIFSPLGAVLAMSFSFILLLISSSRLLPQKRNLHEIN